MKKAFGMREWLDSQRAARSLLMIRYQMESGCEYFAKRLDKIG